jgi:Predicted membrane protein
VLDALTHHPPQPLGRLSTVEPWREILPPDTVPNNASSPAPAMYNRKRHVTIAPSATEAELMSVPRDVPSPAPSAPPAPPAPSAPPLSSPSSIDDTSAAPSAESPARDRNASPQNREEPTGPITPPSPVQSLQPAEAPVLRRSLRNSRPPRRLDIRHTSEKSYYVPPSHFHDIFSAFNCSYNTNFTGPLSSLTVTTDLYGIYAAKADNPDIFTFNQYYASTRQGRLDQKQLKRRLQSLRTWSMGRGAYF